VAITSDPIESALIGVIGLTKFGSQAWRAAAATAM
jgi:hypothetical protein